jgi:hypothetical protein
MFALSMKNEMVVRKNFVLSCTRFRVLPHWSDKEYPTDKKNNESENAHDYRDKIVCRWFERICHVVRMNNTRSADAKNSENKPDDHYNKTNIPQEILPVIVSRILSPFSTKSSIAT